VSAAHQRLSFKREDHVVKAWMGLPETFVPLQEPTLAQPLDDSLCRLLFDEADVADQTAGVNSAIEHLLPANTNPLS